MIDFKEYKKDTLLEGVHDQGIFKAVFLSGGPGSGKDYVLDNTLSGHGLTEINSDKALEYLMDKNNLDKKMPDSEKEVRDFVRGSAKSITDLRQKLALMGRNGLIINGTGDDPAKYAKLKKELESLGYETSMVAVVTRDEISAQRNVERGQRGGRTVPEDIRKQKWDSVNNARPEMAKLFGDKYVEFDNSEDLRNAPPEVVKQKKDEMLDIFKRVQEFVKAPPKSQQAQEWVAGQLQQKDTLPVPKDGAEQVAPSGSGAAEEARKMGLQYYGFGRYGKNGKVTHHSVHDKLVQDPSHAEQEKMNKKASNVSDASTSSGTKDTSSKPKLSVTQQQYLKDLQSKSKQKLPEDFNQAFEDMLFENVDYEFEQIIDEAKEADYGYSYQQSVSNVKTKAEKKPVDMKSLAARMQASYANDKSEPAQTKHTTSESFSGMKTVIMNGHTYIAQGNKPRIYSLRNSAAKDAHQNDGEIVKASRGYMVKLKKDTKHAKISEEFLQVETSSSTAEATSYTVTVGGDSTVSITEGTNINECSESCGCGSTESKGKITLAQIRAKQKEKYQKESIDKGIESGMSMSAGGEGARDTGEKLNKKGKATQVAEMQGDETTASIGDNKENELKRNGISLTTFKKRNYV